MPVFLPLVAYLFLASLSLYLLACLLYLHDRHSLEMCLLAVVTVGLGSVSLAVALLLWKEITLAAQTESKARAPSIAEVRPVTQPVGQGARD